MSKRRNTHLNKVLEYHKNIPLIPEWKSMFFQYVRLFFKWMEPCNHALDRLNEAKNIASTAAALKKLDRMESFVDHVCWMRDGILVVSSMLVFVGMNCPNSKALSNFKQLHDLIDDNILSYLAVIERHYNAIKYHKKLTVKGLREPMTFGEIQQLDIWPSGDFTTAAFVNGQKIMNICTTNRR